MSASLFEHLPATGNIRDGFEQVRALLMQVAAGAAQPNIYALAISTLQFGEQDLDGLEADGNPDALERVREKVRTMISLLP